MTDSPGGVPEPTPEREALARIVASQTYPGMFLKDDWATVVTKYREDRGQAVANIFRAADAILAAGYRRVSRTLPETLLDLARERLFCLALIGTEYPDGADRMRCMDAILQTYLGLRNGSIPASEAWLPEADRQLLGLRTLPETAPDFDKLRPTVLEIIKAAVREGCDLADYVREGKTNYEHITDQAVALLREAALRSLPSSPPDLESLGDNPSGPSALKAQSSWYGTGWRECFEAVRPYLVPSSPTPTEDK